jgi:hypothetical protein
MGQPMGTVGPSPLHSRGRQITIAGVACLVNDVNDPTSVLDDAHILSVDTPPIYVANGYIRFTLRERWQYIQAFSLLLDPLLESDVTAVTDGPNAVNVVDVHGHVATVNAGGFTAVDNFLAVGFILVK